ncbi:3',5'-cyclic-nucleotide phosphodiesterase [Colwellia sp. M166]|uniref:metallophosphoesterase n=1 Tax=Colwellia sp. M166 TaxID=2583805 RepID=UPI00211EFE38|nr:metallophosphoesterase [Colwellia sp. M166]UUO22734.1 3',5'-cyclic-nucleotide phosphodiesterase [Colwellia sp. M166]
MATKFTLAQISDSHLFAEQDGRHHGENVYQNLLKVLRTIKQQPAIDAIVFTGDLTQDHSAESYQLFVQAFAVAEITIPVYCLAGNHDDAALLKCYLSPAPFCQGTVIESDFWQVLLLESKSATPAGIFNTAQADTIAATIDKNKSQLALMHHHAVDVGYFIDRHGLENKAELQQFLTQFSSIKALGCGHVHQALTLPLKLPDRTLNLYTCPATSIQFDINSTIAKSNGQTAGYRLFIMAEHAEISSQAFFV